MRLSSAVLAFSLLLISHESVALCVKVAQANLRSGPSVKSRLLWTVGKYMPLLFIKQKGDWIFVKDLEGKKMWVNERLVSEKIDCAVIKVGQSSLRKGPGKDFALTPLSYSYRYEPFRKVDRDGAWLKLKDDYGFNHWVYENNVWEPLEYTKVTY